MERDYYPLEIVAEMLNCSEDDLIYLGVKERIGIGIIVGNGIALKQVIDSKGKCIEEKIGPFPGQVVKLATYCLKDYVAGIIDAGVILAFYFKNKSYRNNEVLKLIDKNTGEPLLVKNSNESLQVISGNEEENKHKPDVEKTKKQIVAGEIKEIAQDLLAKYPVSTTTTHLKANVPELQKCLDFYTRNDTHIDDCLVQIGFKKGTRGRSKK